jgi:polyhydroxyalkanoate synthesis regulator phasin
MTKEKQDRKEKEGQDPLFSSGMKAAGDFWQAVAKMWPLPFAAFPVPGGTSGETGQKIPEDLWKSLQELWESTFSGFSKAQAREGEDDKKKGVFPPFMMDPFQAPWDGFMLLQKQWSEALDKAGPQRGGEEMGQTFQHVNRTVIEMYGEEFRKLLHIPQLGLTRFYQERANLAVEKFSKFQSAINEFLVVLLKPTGKAFQEMQDEVRRLSEQGEDILQDTKKYYQLWMKKMEDQYLKLLRSPEYTESLGKTLAALKDYRVAREQWMVDLLQDVPVPTNKDMDELYKELYELKKKIRKLEKKGERP